MGIFDIFSTNKTAIMQHPERYDSREFEVFVLTKRAAVSSRTAGDKHSTATMRLIGCASARTDRLFKDTPILTWDLTNDEAKEKRKRLGLRPQTCYRLLVRQSVAYTDVFGRTIPAGRSFFVLRVLERDCRCPILDAMLERYRTPVTITLDGGSVLTLDRDCDWFTGDALWCGEQCALLLNADSDNGETAEGALKTWRKLCAQQEEWDKKARFFAAQELVEIANDWRGDDDPVITASAFMRRIGSPDISIDSEGGFTFSYDDDEMFSGHIIVVEGSLTDGFTSADIVG